MDIISLDIITLIWDSFICTYDGVQLYVAEDVILCYNSTLQVNFCSALWNFYVLFIHEMVLLVHMSDWLYRAIDVT